MRSRSGALSGQKIKANQALSFSHLEKSSESLQLSSNSCFCSFGLLRDHRCTKHIFRAPKMVPKWCQNNHRRGSKQGLANALISGRENDPKWRPKWSQKRPGREPLRALGGLWALSGRPTGPTRALRSRKIPQMDHFGRQDGPSRLQNC